ncbi:MAG: hypothetical protein JNG85_02730, partial [Spirochaetaceae bacterium]|nr:hypothetical protein [Spirochaetaceae bacterium]
MNTDSTRGRRAAITRSAAFALALAAFLPAARLAAEDRVLWEAAAELGGGFGTSTAARGAYV